MFTVTLPRARPPYCLRRHTLLLHGCLATVVHKRHIAYSMHVTVYLVVPCISNIGYIKKYDITPAAWQDASQQRD
jgi:hypothetical protein